MCFNLAFLEQLIVWLIVIGAIVACIKLLVPWVSGLVTPGAGRRMEHRQTLQSGLAPAVAISLGSCARQ
jgi:hypothetical protein